MKEELGLDISEDSLIELNLDEPHTSHFYYTYIDRKENDFTLQKEEVAEVKWYDIKDVIEMMEIKKVT